MSEKEPTHQAMQGFLVGYKSRIDQDTRRTSLCPYGKAYRRLCDYYRRESETVATATLGRSQDVCKGARFPVEGKRFGVSS